MENANGQDAICSILKAQKILIKQGAAKNIGILVDANDEGVASKIANKINPAIEKAFGVKNAVRVPNERYAITYENKTLNIFCCIVNIGGKGELEDILREIRTDKNAEIPICLDRFVQCMNGFNEAYAEKEYKKNFIYFYGFECLRKEGFTPDDLKSKLKKYEYYVPQYWDFSHEKLKDIKVFLELFSDAE